MIIKILRAASYAGLYERVMVMLVFILTIIDYLSHSYAGALRLRWWSTVIMIYILSNLYYYGQYLLSLISLIVSVWQWLLPLAELSYLVRPYLTQRYMSWWSIYHHISSSISIAQTQIKLHNILINLAQNLQRQRWCWTRATRTRQTSGASA